MHFFPIINAKEITISATALEKQWFGAYTILWQPPPGYSKPIRPEAKGQAVEWLASQLKIASDPQTTPDNLEEMITAYQKSEGMIADGIAGPETLIHLNSSVSHTGPTLVE